ncbi:NAD-dependent succinate-semialdehyde dehydrogenase [Deinococcus metallilatus]|uniref:NAD-dependent succinate-semialdehyde dehydrogenase n=1 Tax=Deinococcus metallilatus TaxID=1211322 RepID=A0AAJ5JYD8_9DEIO|nr:NAD-dependent succinate-semialdehyde dehydrogenase [Deinococcus metallilatus]MBB5294110.1 succinate-semialdehyde dehydrogenase/glutarate-semialdehyde dehydrogenase [Deinococcus metallilatus]QBY08895.1 NAD-dependent succinate-semialdehyde dehydrogenase [Deinococcus metallilatus]RXJ10039.1 NAD-dependent succinate-semialdehyde dehydrogenase [Deinococcus metallilatus]TLK28024.1 NAD-dependent succinate-semialdehyde dehydrogenase [Deinococcus metallilatus]GMA16554.1 succinate-semialdehyde dehydro
MTPDPLHPDKTASDSGHRPFATVNPYTGETVREFPFLTTGEALAAVERAHEAFGAWRQRPVEERAAIVRRAGELMLERKDELARLVTLEMGKLIRESGFEVELAASILKYYGEKGPEFLRPQPLQVEGGEAAIVNEPLGVLLGIEPWNFPLYQVARFAAPYLVVGNTILLKHAEICPQSALALEQLFHDAGVPEGVYTNVFLKISDVEPVIAHPAVQGVSLTGSERAGASVAALAGRHLKRCVLELGGSDPFIVLDAPDFEKTIKAAVVGRMANTGQSCVAAKRFIVLDELYDPFVAGLAQGFAGLKPGDPADPTTRLGPLSSERAAQDLMAQVRDAVDQGATVVTGGGRPDLPGAFVDATILTDVKPGMRAYSEELFGPVAVVYRVANDEEAVALANSSSYGLGGAVFCSDLERARAVADRLDSGMVWINHPTSSQANLPFGGVKRSGFGRELDRLGIFEFTNRKLVRTLPAAKGMGKAAQVVG